MREWDAIVVGAGIIGCGIARELARRGARTAIFDSRGPGSGATKASAGVLAPYIEAPDAGALHDLTVRSLALYDDFIAELEEDTGTRVEYSRCGSLEIADGAASVERLTALGKSLRAAGIDAHWLDDAEAMRLEPALSRRAGGLLVPSHGYVRAAQLTATLLDAATRRGAELLAGHAVEPLASTADEGAGGVVYAGGEIHRAATVVIAAGSWSGHVAPTTPSIAPVRGQLLELCWNGPPITRVLWSESCYVVPWIDKTVLVGATVEDVGFDERTTVNGVRTLMEAVRRLLPAADAATFVGARAGLRPSSADGLPVIGRSRVHPAVVYATGHYRNGVLLAPLTARLVGDLVIDGRADPVLGLTAPSR